MLGRAPGRKAMLVFSDGEDQGSHASLADAERRLEASDMTLYMIGRAAARKWTRSRKVMNRLSAASGGRALMTEKPEELKARSRSCCRNCRINISWATRPPTASTMARLRRLKVEVEGHRQIRAREAYRAPSPK
jgi:hypothetical protein